MELKSADVESEFKASVGDDGNVVSQGDISLGCVPSYLALS